MQKKYYPYLIILFIALAAELFMFNIRFWQSMNYKQMPVTNIGFGNGIEYLGGNELLIKPEGERIVFLNDINTDVKNIYIDIHDKRCEDKKNLVNGMLHDFCALRIEMLMTDKGTSEFVRLPKRTVAQSVERTKYIPMQTAGESGRLAFLVEGISDADIAGQTLVLNGIEINKPVPFSFNPKRLVIVYLIGLAVFLLRKGSRVYNIDFCWNKNQKKLTALVIVFNCIICTSVCFSNTFYTSRYQAVFNSDAMMQYDELAKSFLNGHLYLDKESIPALDVLENPYDMYARMRELTVEESNNVWDQAYFKGKFYVYFGVLPVLVYYLPCRLLFNSAYPNFAAILINVFVYIIFAYLLLKEIILQKFKKIPFALYLILSQVMVFSSGILFAVKTAVIYSVPITMALALTAMGLYFWLVSLRKEKKIIWLALGSLAMALVSACRPQFLLASFLAVPIFWDTVFKDRKLFSKSAKAASAAFLLPYIFTAGAVMWYNYARFGSVTDFGAFYNLTTNDMTSRGFNIERLPLGLFAYFIQLPNVVPAFPFLEKSVLTNNYMGITISETMFGGIFAAQPLLWCCFGLKKTSAGLKQKNLFYFVIAALVFSVITACADTEMAGVLCRYYMDFSYLALISASVIALALCENNKNAAYTVVLLCAASLLYDTALYFENSGMYSIAAANPDFYYKAVSDIAFWM